MLETSNNRSASNPEHIGSIMPRVLEEIAVKAGKRESLRKNMRWEKSKGFETFNPVWDKQSGASCEEELLEGNSMLCALETDSKPFPRCPQTFEETTL